MGKNYGGAQRSESGFGSASFSNSSSDSKLRVISNKSRSSVLNKAQTFNPSKLGVVSQMRGLGSDMRKSTLKVEDLQTVKF